MAATTYTRAEIRQRVNDETRDTDTGLVLEAVKNRAISDVVNEFVEYTQCYVNEIAFSLADGTSSGVLTYDKQGNTPTVTYFSLDGWPYYRISDCLRIDTISRWIGTADSDDGVWKELAPVDENEIDIRGLLSAAERHPTAFQMLEFDAFRFLPEINSNTYPIRFKIKYRAKPIAMVDEADPTAEAGEILLPSIPFKYRTYVIPGIIAKIFKLRGDERAIALEQEYLQNREYVRREFDKNSTGRKPKLTRTYVGAGG